MFSQLLNRILGSQESSESKIEELNQKWADWLLPISSDSPAGEDLTYYDSFQDIKEEITKLSGIDYQLIVNESDIILKQNSKDVRVVTYYCLARLFQDGAEGYADGLELLAVLLNKFGEMLYPSRQNIRKNSIEWLANQRFIDQLTQLQPIDENSLSRIIVALDQIDLSCKTLFNGENQNQSNDPPDLSALYHFFNNCLKQQPQSQTSKKEEPTVSEATITPQASSTIVVNNTISSTREVLEQARIMAEFLRENPEEGFLAAGRLLRVIKWDTISELPPADQKGYTRLPAPRSELKNNINRLIAKKQWSELLEQAESAFIEVANHFWLDLQRATIMSLQKMGHPYDSWADIFLADLGLFLERLNGLEGLCFSDGTPFADEETLMWIAANARIHNLDEGESIPSVSVSEENDWGEIETQAVALARSENIEKAFQWLQSLPSVHSPKQRYLLQYTQAKVAEQLGKQNVALKLLIGLNNQQDSLTLIHWEPELIFDVKRCLLRLMKQKNQSKDGIKVNLPEQIEQLQHELMQLDPAKAINLL